MNKWTVLTYYTPNYKEIAEEFIDHHKSKWSLFSDGLGFQGYNIVGVEDKGSWKANTDLKPSIIFEELQKIPYGDVLIVIDIDAKIKQYPRLFDEIPEDFDLALHRLDWELQYGHKNKPSETLSGTIFIRHNERTLALCEGWIKQTLCFKMEQKALAYVVNSDLINGLKVYSLPREYCYISTIGSDRREPKVPIPKENVVIEHYQASREHKRR